MKGKSKYLVLLLLLLVVCGGMVTYAIYKTNKSGNANVNAARWNIVFKNGETEISDNFDISLENATWTNELGRVATGKIAPGSSATFYITLDATGTETDVDYTAEIDESFNESDFEVTLSDDSGTIPYSTATGSMVRQIPIQVIWNGNINDSDTKNNDDLLKKARDITIPIKITAAQKLALSYTIRFSNGGNIVSTRKVQENTALGTLPSPGAAPSANDQFFIGWYDDPTNGNEVTSETIPTSSQTYYARWYSDRIPVVSQSTLPTTAYDGDLTTYVETPRDDGYRLMLPSYSIGKKINVVYSHMYNDSIFYIEFFNSNNQQIGSGNCANAYSNTCQYGEQFLTSDMSGTITLDIPANTSYVNLVSFNTNHHTKIYDIYLSE